MSLRVLIVAFDEVAHHRERWSRLGIQSYNASYEEAMNLIQAPAVPDTIFDAIVIRCTDTAEEDWDTGTYGTPADALGMAEEIRNLPRSAAMYDGKQWRSIPVILACTSHLIGTARNSAEMSYSTADIVIAEAIDRTNYAADEIQKAVVDYRFAVLSEFDDMGFIIRVERGRYMVGPALKPRHELEGRYYFGPADRRPKGFTTVHKENFAVQAEVDEFEALINREDVRESELQDFFEVHSHFLSEAHTPLAQVRLPKADGSVLIPDFILKPIFAQRVDSKWSVLDLKLPNVKLLAGKGSRRRLSARVLDAIAQLRDYKEHLGSSDHANEVAKALGHPLKKPKLGVLIGKLANTDPEALDQAQQTYADVKIVTYDEILERQQTQIEFQRLFSPG